MVATWPGKPDDHHTAVPKFETIDFGSYADVYIARPTYPSIISNSWIHGTQCTSHG